MNFWRVRRYALLVFLSLVLIGGSFWFGIEVGHEQSRVIPFPQGISFPEKGKPEGVDFSLFWKVWEQLQEQFVDKSKIDPQKMLYGAVSGMVKALGDPYTVYLPPEESKRFNDDISGAFGGIGAEIGIRGDMLTIISPLKDSPAEKAGLIAGDKILQINGTSTQDMTIDGAISHIRGEIGTEVTLLILRKDKEKPFEVKLKREVIKVPTVKTEKRPGGIFIIYLYNFNAKASDEFRTALIEAVLSGSSRLVIDLRNNPGGFLESAVDIGSWFLPRGDLVVTENFGFSQEIGGKAKSPNEFRSRGYQGVQSWPVVVLVNGGSASASEILAGALHDHRGIKLIGEKTFGKGSVQQLVDLDSQGSLKVTIAKWFTPSGRSISDQGLDPDIEVKLTEDDVNHGRDPQFDKAIEVVKSLK